jgi:anti-anti-sigma factor
MKLSVASIDKYLVRVEAEGEITMRDFSADGPDPFETLLGAGWASHKVVLDFGKVAFVDSSAIGWLMTCRREFDRNGGLFLVHSIQPRVRQVLDLLRVGKALPLLDDKDAALAVAAASIAGISVTQAEPARTSAPAAASPAAAPSPAEYLSTAPAPGASASPAPKPRARKRKAA